MSNGNTNGIAPNAKRLLFAGFAAILAAGVGAAIRGGILANWGSEFGFTGQQHQIRAPVFLESNVQILMRFRPGTGRVPGFMEKVIA